MNWSSFSELLSFTAVSTFAGFVYSAWISKLFWKEGGWKADVAQKEKEKKLTRVQFKNKMKESMEH